MVLKFNIFSSQIQVIASLLNSDEESKRKLWDENRHLMLDLL